MDLGDLRMGTGYIKGTLDETMVAPTPWAQFEAWFDEARAAEPLDANAMTLATATPDGEPAARVVLLKSVDERGFVFFTNYDSQKGRELMLNPRAALCFYWRALERQVRVSGTVERVAHDESADYFASRPRKSRLSAWASPQEVSASARAGGAGGAAARGRAALCRRRGAGAAVLGRLPGAAVGGRVLAGACRSSARSAALCRRRQGDERLAARAPGAVTPNGRDGARPRPTRWRRARRCRRARRAGRTRRRAAPHAAAGLTRCAPAPPVPSDRWRP